MTFSLVGHCKRTGMVGMAVSTSSICVGARCVWVETGVGAVASQNLTDPRLGKLGLDLLRRGILCQGRCRRTGQGLGPIPNTGR